MQYTAKRRDEDAESVMGREVWTVRFQWEPGDVYIHLFWPHAGRDTSNAFELINVWDYEHGKCEITTREELVAIADQFMVDTGGDELANYWNHTA